MPKRGYHHGDLREALLEAVFDVVAEVGVSGLTVSSLARACGVSAGAPFRHFPTREALLVAAAERAADHQLAAMERAASAAPDDPIEKARARGMAYVRWAVENPGAFRVLEQPEIIAASDRLVAQTEAFKQQLDAVVGVGDMATATPELVRRSAAALTAQALIYGLAKMLTDGALGEVGPDDAERLAREVTGVLGTGLRGP